MNEENKKIAEGSDVEQSAEQQPTDQAEQQSTGLSAPKLLTLNDISKGTLELAVPLRARSKDIKVLHYDFTKLTGWEYAEAMDSDPTTRNMFVVSKKQAICLFAAAVAKVTPDVDATDVKQRIGIADAQRAVQVATLFLTRAAREAGKNTYGE